MIIELLTYLSLLLFTLGQFGRVSLYGQQVNVYAFEIIFFINLLFLIIRYKFSPIKESYPKYRIIFFLFIWLLISYLAGISKFSLKENGIGFFYSIRLFGYFLYFFYAKHHIGKKKQMRKRLLVVIAVCGFITLFVTAMQYFLYPDLRNLLYLGWDPHLYRAFGLFLDPAVAAAVFGLFFFFFLFNRKKISGLKTGFLILSAFFFLAGLLTFSRMSYFAFSFIVLYLLVRERRYLLSFGFIISFFVAILILPKPWGEGVNLVRTYSIDSRIEDYKNAFTIWRWSPIIGIGYNRIRFVKRDLQLIDQKNAEITHAGASFHSSFLIVLVSSGIVGLALFVVSLYRLSFLHKNIKAYILFLTLLSFGDNIILHAFVLFLFMHLALISILPSDR